MTEVRLESLCKAFGAKASASLAVNDLTLTVPQGEFVSLLGPSGCGKTTTLRMIAGLEEPTSGRIWMNDEDVTHTAVQSRRLSMVFQTYAIFPHMSVAANIGYGLRVHRVPRAQRDSRVREVASLVGIGELLERMPRQLSGGQRQRVALARALARDSDLVLFDEPLSNLDAKLRDQTRAELKRIHQELGNTMIYVTHDQLEAMTLSDRIAILNDGVLQQAGTPSDVYHAPENLFVANFIGSPAMNLLTGEVARERAGLLVMLEAGATIAVSGETVLPGRGTVTVGIRPQRLAVSTDVPGRWVVSVMEPVGSEAILHLECGPSNLRALVPYPTTVEAGAKVDVSVPADALLFFDDQTGKRVAA